jgi:hypothetical protein
MKLSRANADEVAKELAHATAFDRTRIVVMTTRPTFRVAQVHQRYYQVQRRFLGEGAVQIDAILHQF